MILWLLASCTVSDLDGPAGSPGIAEGNQWGESSTNSTLTSSVPACASSTPLAYAGGAPSGFEQCDDGRIHRVADLPNVGPIGGTCDDADCGGCGAAEVCVVLAGSTGSGCGCAPTCASDADCGADQACIGAGIDGGAFGAVQVPTCAPAGCRVDAECSWSQCGATTYSGPECASGVALGCRSPYDTCASDLDCGTDQRCLPHQGSWSCQAPGPCDG